MKKKIAALVLAASASIAMVNVNSERVLADEVNKNQIIPQKESNENISRNSSQKAKVVNVTTTLRVRASASTDAKIVGNLNPGATVNVLEKSGSWYKIEYNGLIGYSHSDFLEVVSSGNNGGSTVTGKVGQVINVTTSLRIRSSASTSASIIGHLYANNKVDIIGENGSWYQIKNAGKTGFVHKDYLKVVNGGGSTSGDVNKPITPEVTPDSGKGQVVNVSTNLRIRNTPSTSGNIVGYLTSGNVVDIQGKSGSWYKINYNGKVGFVHSDYIKKVNGNTGGSTGSGNTGNGSGTQVSSKYEQVLSIMKSHVGTPYIYGGTGEEITTASLNVLKNRFPDHAAKGSYNIASKYVNSGYRAFDCSGLMQWGFKQVGVNLGRTTYDQVKNGYEVSPSSAKPGDLLFFSNMGHVGMYIGNGQWIESPKPGQTVRISNVPWNSIGRARRVL